MSSELTIRTTLSEVLRRCSSWPLFCEEFGYSEWAVNEGGGDMEVTLSEEEAERHGIIAKPDTVD